MWRDGRDGVLVVLWCCNMTETTFQLTAPASRWSQGQILEEAESVGNERVRAELAVSCYRDHVSSYREPSHHLWRLQLTD